MQGLPGKKQKLDEQSQPKESRCQVCGIIFESREDRGAKRKFGVLKNTWIGCDLEGCSYWVHVRCSGLSVAKKNEIVNIKYNCPEHKEK